jgi:predicted NAD/FAD-binding protein
MNKEKIAIIGSGISGLSASLFLSKKFDVHLFEKNKILGGHTRTIKLKKNDNNFLCIDTGFIVFNNKNYPDLVSFFKFLDVDTKNSNMSFSVSCKSPNLEYGGASLNSLFAQRKNIFSIKFILLLFEIRRLYKIGREFDLNFKEDLTIEEFLLMHNFSNEIREFHIYPLISSIWSNNTKDVKNFPLISFIQFFNNHGLFSFNDRPKWKFVSGGSYSYVEALIKKNLFKYSTNCQIKKIMRNDGKIQITDNDNKIQVFDKVVFANHADQAVKLLHNPTTDEKNILSIFQYTKNKAYLHSDDRLMPKKKLAWSSWNFLQSFRKSDGFSLTYWMNKLQKIDDSINYFVSINPTIEPINVIDKTVFEHPIFNIETVKAQKELSSIQGHLNTFYCGSYCGYGFHEDGIQSAAYIAKILNVKLPWNRDKNFKSRLNYS